MLKILVLYLAMHGYGFYIWTAFGCVFLYLIIQFGVAWRNWLRIKRVHHIK